MGHILVKSKEEYYHKLDPIKQLENEPWKVQISTNIVRDGTISSNEFAVICILKYAYDINLKNQGKYHIVNPSTVQILHSSLKNQLNISDNRTLINILKSLHKKGIILNLIDKLPKQKPLIIDLNVDLLIQKPFTQLPCNVLKLLEVIHPIGLRLLYYYESYTNRDERKPAYPPQELINSEISISENTCKKYNDLMAEMDILKYVTYPVINTFEYDENDKPIYKRPNNTYEVLINNLKIKY